MWLCVIDVRVRVANDATITLLRRFVPGQYFDQIIDFVLLNGLTYFLQVVSSKFQAISIRALDQPQSLSKLLELHCIVDQSALPASRADSEFRPTITICSGQILQNRFSPGTGIEGPM
jgi:hypothetical protein